MPRFLEIGISVKSGTTILIKRDSLFLREWRIYSLRVMARMFAGK
jgi:hypothetical protein